MTDSSPAERIESLNRLTGITARFSHMRDLDSLSEELQGIIASIVNVKYAGLYLYDPQSESFRLPMAIGFTERERLEAERTAMDRHPGTVIRNRRIIHVADTTTDPRTRSSTRAFTVRSRLWLPIESRDECVGAVGLASAEPHAFSPEHIALLQYVANLAGIVYRNIIDTEALSLAKTQAEKADRAKTEFLATVSHELRTPMNGVLGMTELLLESPLSDEQQQQAKVVMVSALSLMDMIEDLLDYGRIEANQVELEARPFRLCMLVADVVAMLDPSAKNKGLDLSWSSDEGLPQTVIGDVGRLRRILINLIANAIKFTHHGRVDVRISADPPVDGRVRVHLSITDTGIGISTDAQNRLFKRFSQVDGSITRKYGGTGLGLSISQALANLMAGGIELAHSSPGEGSRFVATVELGHRTVAHDSRADPDGAPARRANRVLIVDDNAVNRTVASLFCRRLEWETTEAADGDVALRALERAPFDLVLMDIHMPTMDGITATEHIRKMSKAATSPLVPVIAVSADRQPETQRRCFAAGANAFLAKPLTLESLQAALHRFELEVPAMPSGGTILIADDHPINRAVLSRMVAMRGYKPVCVEDGRSAIEALKGGTFALALLDLHLRGMDGAAAVAELRRWISATELPIYIVTGDTREQARAACLAAGAQGVLSKPLDRAQLDAVLLRQRHAQEESA